MTRGFLLPVRLTVDEAKVAKYLGDDEDVDCFLGELLSRVQDGASKAVHRLLNDYPDAGIESEFDDAEELP